jgi:hypothetical protein
MIVRTTVTTMTLTAPTFHGSRNERTPFATRIATKRAKLLISLEHDPTHVCIRCDALAPVDDAVEDVDDVDDVDDDDATTLLAFDDDVIIWSRARHGRRQRLAIALFVLPVVVVNHIQIFAKVFAFVNYFCRCA